MVDKAALSVIPCSCRNSRTAVSVAVKFFPRHMGVASDSGSYGATTSSVSAAGVMVVASSRRCDEQAGNEKRRVAPTKEAILFVSIVLFE